MKTTKITLVFTAFILISTLSFSQTKAIAAGSQYPPQIPITTFEGKLSIKGMMKGKNIKEKTPVDLFKAFKEGVYKINFNFKTSDVKADQIILFDMKTTVKHNGKTISETSRKGWPWIPGDIFVPIEAFDAIPAVQKLTAHGLPTDIPFKNGSYEFIFQFVPSEGQKVKGSISPASMKFTIE